MAAERMRLIGGRYDGKRFEFEWDFDPEPFVHIFVCPYCDEVHYLDGSIWDEFPGKDEARDVAIYALLRIDGDEAVYIEQALPADTWSPTAGAKADRELVPA